MKAYVFWGAIAGPQYGVHPDFRIASLRAFSLVTHVKHSNVYVYDPEDKSWTHYTPGVRGRAQECEIPEDEVPKVFRLLLTLES